MGETRIELRFDSGGEAAIALARRIGAMLGEAIAARGVALIAVSGGRSPAAVFEALRDQPLDWDKVIIAQVDERWVPPDHPDSNSRLIREHLLTGLAGAARFVPMWNSAESAYAGQPDCESGLAALPRPFDLVLLGMGEDGHTASLFPDAGQLEEGLTTASLCLSVTSPAAPHDRMSLSLAGLLDSRLLILQIGGGAKEKVYRAALGPGPVEAMPVRAVLRQDRVPLEVWISA
jgi:6-phosphogluconolactonase